MNQRAKQKGLSVPYYGVTVLWLLLAILQQSGRLAVAMGLSVGIFLLLRIMCLYTGSQPTLHDTAEKLQASTNPQSEQILQKCTTATQNLNCITQQIQNIAVRKKVSTLADLSKKILNEVTERPEKIFGISTFVNYYVPTTINILNAYRRAEAAGIEGKNINKTKEQIESMLDSSILVVFHKQLDSLFGADALDISLELSVLEEMMLREGITGEKLEAQTTKNADGSDIQLTL